MSPALIATHILLVAAVGIAMEGVFTALVDFPENRDPKLMGYTYVWSVHGLIRLDYAPAWLGAAFVFEWVFRVLRGLT